MRKQAAIAGAGIMGLLAARELLALGWKVNIFEKCSEENYRHSTSFSAAGTLLPFTELEIADPMTHALGLESLELWPDIINTLESPVYFKRNGSLILAHARDRALFEQLSRRITSQLSPEAYEWIKVRDLEPELCESFEQGLYLPYEAHLDNAELMPILLRNLLKSDCRISFGEEVEQLMPHIVETRRGSTIYDLVIDCRGIGAQKAIPDLRAVRGEAFLVHAPEVTFDRPIRLMHPRYGIYVVPRAEQRFYIGATMIESASEAPVTVRSTLEMLSAAYSLHRGFSEASLLHTYTGLRAALPHNEPRIQVTSGKIVINGLFRHGFMLAPSLARCLRLIIEEKPIPHGGRLLSSE